MDSIDISVIILAGGESRRMGQDKRCIQIAGKSLTSYSIDLAEAISDDILFSANMHINEFGDYKFIPDQNKGAGPLNGIVSTLKYIKYKKAIVLTCDMPFITPSLLKKLIEEHTDDTISYYTHRAEFHPFPSIFPASLIKDLTIAEFQGISSMKAIFDLFPTKKVQLPEGLHQDSFLNVNRPQDFKRAQELGSI